MKIVIFFSIITLLTGYFFNEILLKIRILKYEKAVQENFISNNPDKIQNFFLNDVKDGVNDEYTKSAAFLIVNRYVANGGNVYEVFDFVEANPEVSFLKDAETIYPKIFNDVKRRDLQLVYSDRGMYVYLAYFETLTKNGYGNIAIAGTLIGQYAKSTYYKKKIVDEKATGGAIEYPDYSEEEIKNDNEKALFFINKYKDIIINTINATSSLNDVTKRDLLEGVIQYASGLRYLEAKDGDVVTSKETKEVFNFATSFSYYFVKDYYLPVSLSNASTLLIFSSSTSNELRNAIYPFLNFDSKKDKPKGVTAGIIGAKYRQSVSKFADLGISSKVNIVSLGNRVPEFKSWLIFNGWTSDDFR